MDGVPCLAHVVMHTDDGAHYILRLRPRLLRCLLRLLLLLPVAPRVILLRVRLRVLITLPRQLQRTLSLAQALLPRLHLCLRLHLRLRL